MALKYPPRPGAVLKCDYRGGFEPPEMVKTRCVVVISPRFPKRKGLATVVPLSTTPPRPVMGYHCTIRFDPPLPRPFDGIEKWVKADMVATVSEDRLSALFSKVDGKRIFDNRKVSDEDLARIRECVRFAIGDVD